MAGELEEVEVVAAEWVVEGARPSELGQAGWAQQVYATCAAVVVFAVASATCC